jgi:hypothetical protein
MEYNAPVMLAKAPENRAVKLASSAAVPIDLRPDFGGG